MKMVDWNTTTLNVLTGLEPFLTRSRKLDSDSISAYGSPAKWKVNSAVNCGSSRSTLRGFADGKTLEGDRSSLSESIVMMKLFGAMVVVMLPEDYLSLSSSELDNRIQKKMAVTLLHLLLVTSNPLPKAAKSCAATPRRRVSPKIFANPYSTFHKVNLFKILMCI